MSKIAFPAIPVLENGMVLSAATLNHAFTAAERWLLGESHAPLACQHTRFASTDVYQEDYQTIWTCYLRHTSNTLVYKLHIKINYGNAIDRDWYYQIQVYDGSTWYTAKTETGTDNTYQNKEGTVDLTTVSDGSGGYIDDHLVAGTVYQWRLQVKCGRQGEPADCTVHCLPWTLRLRNSVSGWQTPPTFAAATSSADDFNDMRTDLNALYAAMSDVNIHSTQMAEHEITSVADTWEEYTSCVYRYRPESIYCNVQGCTQTHSDPDTRYWKWRLAVYDDTTPTANGPAYVYTSDAQYGAGLDPNQYTWDSATIDLTAGAAASALSTAGITLTFGNYYRLVIEVCRGDANEAAYIRHGILLRLSDNTPDAGWDTLNDWAHGDTDVGPMHLNKLADNLTDLYTGNERLWNETLAVDTTSGGLGCAGVHRKRYLHYIASAAPRVYYGVAFDSTYDLSASNTWTSVDLGDVGVPYGTVYFVDNVTCAFECDEE